MPKIEIWMEGYLATGGHGEADKIWEGEAIDFNDAVEKYSATISAEELEKYGPRRYTRGNFISEEAWLNRRADWNIWACALFDNEADARKSFG
jgi:hypothetical protein